jgi:hypothetical protein
LDNTFFKAKREKKIRKKENVVGAKLPNMPPHLKEDIVIFLMLAWMGNSTT